MTTNPAPQVVTLVATGKLPAHVDLEEFAERIGWALRDQGLDFIGCDWAPDADTIQDAVDATGPVTVLDLNPTRAEAEQM